MHLQTVFLLNDIYLRWFGGSSLKIVGEVTKAPKVLGMTVGTQNTDQTGAREELDAILKAHQRVWSCAVGRFGGGAGFHRWRSGGKATGGELLAGPEESTILSVDRRRGEKKAELSKPREELGFSLRAKGSHGRSADLG